MDRSGRILISVFLFGVAFIPVEARGQQTPEPCNSSECCQKTEGAELYGEVLAAESGTPIPDATVEFQVTSPLVDEERSTHEVRTDGSGSYRLCGLSTPATVEAQAERSGATSQRLNFRLDAARPVELTFKIRGVPVGLDSLKKAAAASRAEAEHGRITGRIEDAETGRPVAEATVELEPGGRTALTDGRGKFAIPDAPAGKGKLAIHHVAYGDQTVAVDIPLELTLNLDIELPPKAIEVEPVEVKVESTIRDPYLERRGFYDRMERGWGYHFSPEYFEKYFIVDTRQLLRRIPGVKVGGGGYGRRIEFPQLLGCSGETQGPLLFIDGHRIGRVRYTRVLREYVNMGDVGAVEVYRRPSEMAPEFISSDSRCGVIVIWTKHGPDPRSRQP